MTTGKGERYSRWRRGAWSEIWAALWLMGKGYRILARRYKTAAGEIDLIVVRGRRLVFIEVKQRGSQASAQASIGFRQRQRVRRAADLWLARHPRYQRHQIAFDAVFLIPGHWPRHVRDGL